jgi:hypothetical protein
MIPSTKRKQHPVATGVIDYFPDALMEIANVSYIGNEQHNPGQPLHWDRSKSTDEADALMRHFIQRGEIDEDGTRHTAKIAWRALAMLQKELEAAKIQLPGPSSSASGSPSGAQKLYRHTYSHSPASSKLLDNLTIGCCVSETESDDPSPDVRRSSPQTLSRRLQ